ncbi:MAG: hypothetical protein IKS09_00040 [Lachnospiraceae bacterium]|nr:hypothetical protein [Lachnospiraceae bacterium]
MKDETAKSEGATIRAYDKHRVSARNYPAAKNGEHCEYLGYIFALDGMVISPSGNILEPMPMYDQHFATLILYDENVKKHLVRVCLEHACYSMFAKNLPKDKREKYIKAEGNAYVKDMDISPKRRKTSSKTGRSKKFKAEDITNILKDYNEYGYTYRSLAEKYETSVVTVLKIVKGKYL